MSPKVSVCIPTYNSKAYLAEAIESVLAQEFQDYELVISDNASTDGTAELCRLYTDPRVRYHRFDELVTQGGNWNRCLSLARGEYVALLHADDVYHSAFLTERVRVLDEHPEVGLAFGAVQLIEADGQPAGISSRGDEPFVLPAPGFFAELLLGCVINPVSPVVRRACYEQVGSFNEVRVWGVDWEMWLRLASRFGVAYSPRVVASYRLHGKSGTSAGMLGDRKSRDDMEVLENAFRSMDEQPQLARFIKMRRTALHYAALRDIYSAGYNCEAGNLPGVRDNLRCASRTDASLRLKPTYWALWLSSYLGPGVYRAFRRVRPT